MATVEISETVEELEVKGELVSVDVLVEYELYEGEEATGPTYSCGGTPGYDPSAEFVRYTIECIETEDGLYEGSIKDVEDALNQIDWDTEDRQREALEQASEDEEGAWEAAQEAKFDAMRDGDL